MYGIKPKRCQKHQNSKGNTPDHIFNNMLREMINLELQMVRTT